MHCTRGIANTVCFTSVETLKRWDCVDKMLATIFAILSNVTLSFVLFFFLTEGRILELHSPDGVHECWLRAADSTEANVWFNALHSALAVLTLKALRLASALPDPQQLQHIGWLARRHCLQVRKVPKISSGKV